MAGNTPQSSNPYQDLSFNKRLGLNIALRRQELGLKQIDLAQKLHVTRYWLGKREKGEVDVTVRELDQIAIALQCSVSYLKPEL